MTSTTAKRKKKLTFVLLDAVIVIEIHELGIWEDLIDRVAVMIPSTVVHDEAFYFKSRSDNKNKPILLKNSIKSGRVTEITASTREISDLERAVDYATLLGLDPGELEALALVKSGSVKDALFCTADGPAIRALALLGYSDRGISFENLLRNVGLERPLKKRWFMDDFFREHLTRGLRDRILNTNLTEL